MKYRHYPHDDQLEGHKAREREKARVVIVNRIRIEQARRVQEIIKDWRNSLTKK